MQFLGKDRRPQGNPVGHQNPVIPGNQASGRYKIGKKLGKGVSGSVYQGIDSMTGNLVAIKVIKMKQIDDEVKDYLLKSQQNALSGLKHPNIIRCLDIVRGPSECLFVFQFCPQGTLEDYLKKKGRRNINLGKVPQQEAVMIFSGVVSGTKAIADAGVVHRDLKPSNILMVNGIPKISDFGFCEITGSVKPKVYYNVGSPSYMSPQAYMDNIYGEKSDVWSLGAIYYEMLVGKTIDAGRKITDLYDYLKAGRPFLPTGISPFSTNVLARSLKYDWKQRIGIKQLHNLVSKNSMHQLQKPGSALEPVNGFAPHSRTPQKGLRVSFTQQPVHPQGFMPINPNHNLNQPNLKPTIPDNARVNNKPSQRMRPTSPSQIMRPTTPSQHFNRPQQRLKTEQRATFPGRGSVPVPPHHHHHQHQHQRPNQPPLQPPLQSPLQPPLQPQLQPQLSQRQPQIQPKLQPQLQPQVQPQLRPQHPPQNQHFENIQSPYMNGIANGNAQQNSVQRQNRFQATMPGNNNPKMGPPNQMTRALSQPPVTFGPKHR